MAQREIEGDWVFGWPDRKRAAIMPSKDADGRVIFARSLVLDLEGMVTPVDANAVVTLLNGRAANWHRTQAQAAAVAVAVCHRPIAWLRNWRNVFREIRWRWTLKVL